MNRQREDDHSVIRAFTPVRVVRNPGSITWWESSGASGRTHVEPEVHEQTETCVGLPVLGAVLKW